MQTDKKLYQMKWDGINFMVGSFTGKTSKRSKSKGRTNKTYNNKITKLKAIYNSHPKMVKKYSTFEDWLKVVKIKQLGDN